MATVSYRMTIDDNGASDAKLGLYANFAEEAFQLAINQPEKSLPKQLLLLAALSGQVTTTIMELGALVEAEEDVDPSQVQALLDKLDDILPKLTALTLMLNYSTKGQVEDGKSE